MNKTIYIAGPVTGHDENLVADKFHRKEAELLALGHDIINPVREVHAAGLHSAGWARIMKHCIAAMMNADEVHLLHGWQHSSGTQLEREIALRLGMPIVYP